MPDAPTSPAASVPPDVTIRESAAATLADFTDLTGELPGDTARSALAADRISEEVSELAAMLRALPARPAAMSGHDHQMLAALRSAHRGGFDVGETVARALARLAAELGSSDAVLRNRPGSWEASHIAALLAGEVGADDQYLDMYRATS
jgi:hypothetical protein